MSITQRLMAQGGFSLKLTESAPRSVRAGIAVFDHIIFTGVAFDNLAAYSDSAILSASIFTGVVERRNDSGFEFGGFDLSYWLGTDDGRGDLLDTAVSQTSATLSSWISALLPASITAGTITNTGLSTSTNTYFGMTRREAIDAVCLAANRAEWRVNPNGTIDAAAPATLFVNTPTTVVTKKKAGRDGAYDSVEATEAVASESVEGYTSKGIAVAGGMRVGSASITPPYKDFFNNTVVMERFVNAPDANPANAINIAGAVVDQYGVRTELKLRSNTYTVTRFAKPGDWVYVYDLDAGIVDTANQVMHQGELITPKKLRVYGLTYPITKGMGVYARRSGATPTYIDLTPHVDWENSDVSWDVGAADLPLSTSSGAGAVRFGSNPEVTTRNYLPGGIIGYAEITSTQSPFTTIADVTSLTVTWDANSARRYRISFTGEVNGTVAGDLAILYITDSANVAKRRHTVTIPALTSGVGYQGQTFHVVETGLSGSVTRKIRFERNVGSGTISLFAASTSPASILVEDVGPA